MTDEQINLAIHKAVGFEWNDKRRLWERNANKARVVSHNPFYYSSDLNLMHEAENCLSLDDRNHYIDALGTIHTDSWEFATATARQRAEAFLRTLGKWEEVQK